MKKYMATVVMALSMSVVQADTYQATNWMAPSHILNGIAFEKLAVDLKKSTNGDIDFEIFSSGSLVPAQTTLSAVGDGVAQLGVVAASYTPSELPLSGMINDLAFVATDDMATAFAFTELLLKNKRLIKEYEKHNTVVLGGYSTPTYVFLCMKDVKSIDDVKGKKIRTNGTAQNEWITQLGGIPVAVPMTDVYSGLERGAIDCTLSDPTNLATGYRFWEIAKSITTLEQGTALGVTYVVNKDFWREIGKKNRQLFLNDVARNLARTQIAYAQTVEIGMKGAKERKIRIIQPDSGLVAALKAFRANIIDVYPKRTQTERKVKDPRDVAQEFLQLQEKWVALLSKIDRYSEDEVTQLLKTELYAKLADSYGL